MPEARRLFPAMTVRENLLMGAFARGDRAAIAEDLEKMLALFPRVRERLQVLGVNAMDDDADPEESPAAIAAEALKRGYVFPYLSDQSQAVARVFGAERTPEAFPEIFSAWRPSPVENTIPSEA